MKRTRLILTLMSLELKNRVFEVKELAKDCVIKSSLLNSKGILIPQLCKINAEKLLDHVPNNRMEGEIPSHQTLVKKLIPLAAKATVLVAI